MSLFQHLGRPLRPTTFSATSTFGTARTVRSPRLARDFFNSSKQLAPRRPNVYFSPPFFTSGGSWESANMTLIYGIMGLNAGIFAYSVYTKEQARQGHPSALTAYIKNMTLSTYTLFKEHRYWTLLTSTVSHIEPMHLAGNMLSLFFMGGLLARHPGFTPAKLLTLTFGSGLAGSVLWLGLEMRKEGNGPPKFALGFSGCVMGIGTVAAFLYPKTQFAIYGIIPVPLWALMAGYAVLDGFLLNNSRSKTAHGGHLGGTAFGVLYYFARMRGLRV